MTRAPELTDRTALARNRARADPGALFLHDEALAEIKERLIEVNRRFMRPAIVAGQRDPWTHAFPDARVVTDDEVLALDPGAHDLVIHAMALHWSADPVGQIVQARRALRPDGLFLGVLPGGQTLAGLRTALAGAEVALTGGLSPRVLPMGELRDLGALLQRAGLALPVADSVIRQVSYADAFALMRDLRAMGEGNALAGRLRRPTRRAVLERAAELYACTCPDPAIPGRVLARFDLIFLTGWAPAAGQQKPLRPGSAAARLADALGTDETPLPRDLGGRE
jgi:SAM-dependent methyltransferase